MTYGRIAGLDRDISKLVMGCDNQMTFPHAQAMFDAWFEAGGNAFDTAYHYNKGLQETFLGQWHTQRHVRDDIVITVKGACVPHCNPQAIRDQLQVSLDRLQIDCADLYFMHRDNLDVPVGEFIDVLHEETQAGRLRIAGGSNWSRARFEEANAYAEKNGKQKLSFLGNNFSLAKMIHPVWPGCVTANTPDFRAFLETTQTPHLAWSSQARGYFISPDTRISTPKWEHSNAWDNADNRMRRKRAFELASQHGVTAMNIAAAYVLAQAFPSFALIGPRTLEELRTTLPALGIHLTAQEIAYLDLRE